MMTDEEFMDFIISTQNSIEKEYKETYKKLKIKIEKNEKIEKDEIENNKNLFLVSRNWNDLDIGEMYDNGNSIIETVRQMQEERKRDEELGLLLSGNHGKLMLTGECDSCESFSNPDIYSITIEYMRHKLIRPEAVNGVIKNQIMITIGKKLFNQLGEEDKSIYYNKPPCEALEMFKNGEITLKGLIRLTYPNCKI